GKTDDNGFRLDAKMKVGPVSARFKVRVTLSDLDPPNGYRISGEGEGGVAGFVKGGPRSRSPRRTAAPCSPTTSRRRSAASSRSSASAWSTVPPRRSPTISFRNSPPRLRRVEVWRPALRRDLNLNPLTRPAAGVQT